MAARTKQILAKKQQASKPAKVKLRKDDVVKVIAGRDKGKTGRILEINAAKGRAVVEGVMIVKRHTRPNPQQQVKGGIAEREGTIAISNIMLVTSDGKTSRIGFKVDGERRVRIARRTGESIERSSKSGK